MDKPAILGGIPVRDKEHRIFYGHQSVTEEDIEAVAESIRTEYLTGGPGIGRTEKRLCEITDAKYAVLCANGTAALHLACMAVGIKEGDEVIVSSITFAASANCVLYCGGTPVFADIRPDTYNIDVEDVRRKITDRTKAIVAVDFTGQAVQLDELKEICKEHNLYLIEDAAHSIGTKYKGRPVGSIADITTFSFHPVKTVTAGEGGACMTNDPELYKKLHLLVTHGITKNPDEMERTAEGPWYMEQIMLGFNYRITEFQAALLMSQLNKLEAFSKRRKEIRKAYDEAFKDEECLFIQESIHESDTTQHLYVIRLNPEKLSCTRREFFDALTAEGTCPQVHYIPVYRHPYYEHLGYKKGLCPNAEYYYENSMSIPFYAAMTDEDVADTIKAIKKLCAYYRK
ncbi:MAG: UDP-4-amino-4,6-dideoxy-N-acetyl-beta-L-altrosamine transaminase [Lachnospiraceae bacterium]|nr:UDP-4-amino-4,6-dideoxy-N-acetyl-beta-L-altrosamine transaminase [Lachnospiraceae bacterium]